jgi:cell pole-organizing protein PopZ
MTSPPNPQHEPTMEEILASIRKIISEDQNEAAKPAAPMPAQAASVDDGAVLELDQEIRSDGSVMPVAMEPARPTSPSHDNGMSELTFDTGGKMKPEMAEMGHEDLISDAARNAVGRAFVSLDSNQQQEAPMPAGGSVEAAFENAVRSAFEPALHQWVDSRSNEIMEQLKPLIRQWMDDNLPALIENAVRNEIARAVRTRGR